MIICVLGGSNFIHHLESNNWVLNKSLFKELAKFIRLEEDATSVYKVMSSAYEIILVSWSSYISAVYKMKCNRSKTLPSGTPETTNLNLKND